MLFSDKWFVFGGSWGSTLSLTYAIHHPDKVKALMLRGIFMCRRSELLFFYQDGASHLFPDKFQPYRELIPVEERGDMIAAYYKRLTSSDGEVRRAAAKEWTLWEMGTSKLMPDPSYINKVNINGSSLVMEDSKKNNLPFLTSLIISLCFVVS